MPPRIRTLKPELFQHVKVGALSHFCFRLWVGCLTHADDDGRGIADPRQLRMMFFGYHPRITIAQVAQALEELASVGLVGLYTVADRPYLWFPSWRDHQRIHKNHYTPSRLPAPPVSACAVPIPDGYGTDPAGSGSGSGSGSGRDLEGKGSGREWKGREGIGEGRERTGGTSSPGPPSQLVAAQAGSNDGLGPPASYEEACRRVKAANPHMTTGEVEAFVARGGRGP